MKYLFRSIIFIIYIYLCFVASQGEVHLYFDNVTFITVLGFAIATPFAISKDLKLSEKYKTARVGLYLGALITVFSGLIALLADLDDVATIGPKIAIAILGPLHALVLDIVWFYPEYKAIKFSEENDDVNSYDVEEKNKNPYSPPKK